MIVFGLVKRIDIGEVGISIIGAVVTDNIEHHPDITGVASLDQRMQVVRSPEVLIDLLPVKSTVAVVIRRCVMGNWRDPDCIEPHSLNVV